MTNGHEPAKDAREHFRFSLEAIVNAKSLVRFSAPLLLVSTVALLAACGGSVDATSCASIKPGNSRGDVDSELGSPVSVTKGDGSFATARYETERDGKTECCFVRFASDSDTALALTAATYDNACVAAPAAAE